MGRSRLVHARCRIAERGIPNFWNMVNITKKAELSAHDKVTQLPPLACARCLEAMNAEIEAAPPPEALRHAVYAGGEKTKILAEYRRALEDMLDKFLVSTWQSCARQL